MWWAVSPERGWLIALTPPDNTQGKGASSRVGTRAVDDCSTDVLLTSPLRATIKFAIATEDFSAAVRELPQKGP